MMANRTINVFGILLVVCVSFIVNVVGVSAWSGTCSGTQSNPCEISSWESLNWVRNNLNTYYILTADLNSSTAGYAGVGNNWQPIGTDTSKFFGNFNGNGHTISDLAINNMGFDPVGLFTAVDVNFFGGLGDDSGKIYSLGLINVSVNGPNFVGGLVGHQYGGMVSDSYVTGVVNGAANNVGGLIGVVAGTVNNSYSMANVSGGWGIGGLVGWQEDGEISDSYSIGSVVGLGDIGGLVGGQQGGVVSNSIWNTETSGCLTSAGGIGKTTAEMNVPRSFLSWDIGGGASNLNNGYPYLAWQAGNDSYAWLSPYSFMFSDGNGSVENPYQIHNWTQLNATRLDLSAAYILVSSLNSSVSDYDGIGNDWVPIGDESNLFSGVFNGSNNIISDLIINQPGLGSVGLFGSVSGSIMSVGLINVSVNGLSEVGSLVGYQHAGIISNSYAIGVLDGGDYSGGLVGDSIGTISNSYSAVNVSGGSDVGGLVGSQEDGTISNSYSIGSVVGSSFAGGLVGHQYGGAVSNSYWDINSSGQETSDGGIGKTTLQMKSFGTFRIWNVSFSNADLNNGYPYLAGQAENNSYVWLIFGEPSSSGEGTLDNPYQIHNWTELNNVRNDLSAAYILLANLSSDDLDYEGIGDSWVPIGWADGWGEGDHFLGNFNGSGNIISDLIINLPDTDYVGLFGYSEGEISNIGLINVNVSGLNSVGGLVGWQDGGFINNSYASGNIVSSDSSWWVGGLVGYQGDATISNSYFIGNVTSSSSIYVGGLVGESRGLIDYSYASADVTGFEWVGGLAGSQGSSTVNNSYATGNVNGSSIVGGLVGKQDYGGIYNSYATGNVFGEDSVGGLVGAGGWSAIGNSYATGNVFGGGSAGGLAGDYDGGIYNSYATGNVNGSSAVGGLAGASGGGIDHSATVSGSYATGDVTGSGNWVGGLIGIQMRTDTSDCYATGSVTGSGDYVGGLVGWHTSMGSISNSYFIMSLAVRGNNYTGVLVGSVSSGSNVTDSYAIVDVAADFGGTGNVGFIGLNDGLFSSSYLTIRNRNYGNITFLTENVSGNIGSNSVNISNNFASVNSISEPGLNKSANVSFLNIPAGKLNYTILKNGEACLDCFNFTVLSGNVTFNVTSWSNYTIYYEDAPTCSDGIKNGGETGLDCGGSCDACSVTGRAVGSSGGRSVPMVYALLDLQFGNRLTKNLKEDDQIVFNVSNQSHKLTLNSFNSQSANVTIESTPRDYIVKINEMIAVDLNEDGVNDVSVSYLKYVTGFAQLEIVKLNLQGNVDDTNVVDQFIEKNQYGSKILFISSIVLLVLILLFFILFFIVSRRNR